MGRGTAFAGLRYGAVSDRLNLMLLLGGGFQYEDPDTTTFTGGQNLRLTSEQNVTAQASGRLLVRASAVPQIPVPVLGARLASCQDARRRFPSSQWTGATGDSSSGSVATSRARRPTPSVHGGGSVYVTRETSV
jgi:hypothetical protein